MVTPVNALAGTDYWDSLYEPVQPQGRVDLAFRDLFEAFLSPGGTCFEVGCYPGTFLAYLCRTFGYQANGIDTTPFVVTRLPQFLSKNGVQIGELIRGDFLRYQSDRRYDVVCSFGFLEHFVDYRLVIRKHAELVNEGGTLILTCPNFRRAQWLLRYLLDPEDLRRHVLASMNFKAWADVLKAEGMNILIQSYYRTIGFWTSYQSERSARGELARMITYGSTKVDRRINLPNPLTSPLMVSISRKA